ncbi:unnamed protein product [Penicillium camemberti]|uniref:Str. FM013 n=1 Tax=Penicillium camemberti (strain FM 013) TaxID=1429867 RepID=A0A0G4PIE8_PENC3|nr:unnamed protein product [Penicillium camemberti]
MDNPGFLLTYFKIDQANLEAKGPLYAYFMESTEGLTTIYLLRASPPFYVHWLFLWCSYRAKRFVTDPQLQPIPRREEGWPMDGRMEF